MLRAACGGADRCGRYAARAVLGYDDARSPDGACRAQYRTDVLRVLEMVEYDDERIFVLFDGCKELVEADLRIARGLEGDALVVPEARELVQLVALHRSDDQTTRVRLVADAADLVVFVGEQIGRAHV